MITFAKSSMYKFVFRKILFIVLSVINVSNQIDKTPNFFKEVKNQIIHVCYMHSLSDYFVYQISNPHSYIYSKKEKKNKDFFAM